MGTVTKVLAGIGFLIGIGLIVGNPKGSSAAANSIGGTLINETKALQLR